MIGSLKRIVYNPMSQKGRISGQAVVLGSVLSLSAIILTLSNVILARSLSQVDFGMFSVVVSLSAVLSVPTSGGMQLLLNREVSKRVIHQEFESIRGTIRFSYAWAVTIFCVVFLAAIVYDVNSSGIRSLRVADYKVASAAILTLPMALIAINAGVLRGFDRPVIAALPPQLVQPALLLTIVCAISLLGTLNLEYTLAAQFLALISAATMATFFARKVIGALPRGSLGSFDAGSLVRLTLTFSALSAIIVLSANIAIIYLGFEGLHKAAAELRVAERGGQLVAFPILMLESIIVAKFVASLKTEPSKNLKQYSKQSSRISFSLAIIVAAVLLLPGEKLLEFVFGSDYAFSYQPMIILVAFYLFHAATGPAALILVADGREKQVALVNLVSVLVILMGCTVWAEKYGSIGAASSIALGLLLAKILLLIIIKKKHNIFPGIF
ncbi:hypothetical protein [Sphingomicrobium astaxanthinifaciens]|uniref:hypothetical protein n=1 Tax=Sphingomicrobium astaxanthinifaciens TaxID=1227949 RepID=UPI001FCC1C19|nr:hypothetical protein [Sphingomicrobium astaxanthinifaciens]MCJ7420414.1 hypothetical protein [Sphingomicrobium astaxanthinifaciens]